MFVITKLYLINMNAKILKGFLLGASIFLPTTLLFEDRRKGQAWSFGFGRNGELGIGSENNTSLPQAIKNLQFVDIDSKKSVSAGITSQGKVFTWGKNRNGIIGHNPPNLNVAIPRELDIEDKIIAVSCGYQHTCVVTDKGEVYSWGLEKKKSSFRQRGIQETEKKEQIIKPAKLPISNIKQVSCSNEHTLFVSNDGRLFVMGDIHIKNVENRYAQSKTEILELNLKNITKVSSGINFSMALTDEGRVYIWGNNTFGQLGTGGLKGIYDPFMVESLMNDKVVDISCGDNYSGVVTEKGEVYTWGFGNQGQLGHGEKTDQYLPRKVATLKDHKIKSISCGGAHTALLTNQDKLFMVGRGREGQLGRQQKDQSNSGYTLQAKEVEQLPEKRKIQKVVCGGSHTLVLLQNLV